MSASHLNEHESAETQQHNRIRLIAQNKKLSAEIFRLEQHIDLIIAKRVENNIEFTEVNEELKTKFRSQMEGQLQYINKLKSKVKTLKNLRVDHEIDQVKDAENELTCLRQELEKLMKEKKVLESRKEMKQESLKFTAPLNEQTNKTFEDYKRAKQQSTEIKLKITQLQRQILKYHNWKEMSKTAVPKNIENSDYQFIEMQTEMKSMRKEMRAIQSKWKNKIEGLDQEYFQLKGILQQKQKSMEAILREEKSYQTRTLMMKSDDKLLLGKERLKMVVVDPSKRKEIEKKIKEDQNKYKRLEPKTFKAKQRKLEITNKDELQTKNDVPKAQIQVQTAFQQIKPSKDQIKSERRWENPENKPHITQYTEKNEFFSGKQPSISEKKQKKMESIGVGTSFYFQDE